MIFVISIRSCPVRVTYIGGNNFIALDLSQSSDRIAGSFCGALDL